jgi:hypothetical protein
MSKNTKIIAIVGGVLIVLGLAYMMFSGGSTMEAIGCGTSKGKKARQTVSKADVEWAGCKRHGYIPQLEEKKAGNNSKQWVEVGGKRPLPSGGKGKMKKATCDCLGMWKAKCDSTVKDKKGKTFKDKNSASCTAAVKTQAKKGCGGDEADDGDDGE